MSVNICKKQKVLFNLLGLGSALLFNSFATDAQAINFVALPSDFNDADFNYRKNNVVAPFQQNWEKDWVAEVRGGRHGLSGDWELGINDWNNNNQFQNLVNKQNIFTSGQAVDFSVTYDGVNANFVWGTNLETPISLQAGNLTESSRFDNGLDSLYIRLRANNDQGAPSNSFAVNNIKVDDELYSGSLFADNNDKLDYLLITGITESFSLTGTAIMTWEGDIPRGSRLDMTIKTGYGNAIIIDPETGEPVPEPLTILGSMVALGFGGLFKKKFSSQNSIKN